MQVHRSFPLRGVALAVVIAAVGLVGCGSDDSDEANEPTTTGVVADTADTGAADQGEPGTPPDDAVDLTGETEVTVAVGDNKYTERTIVVSPGTDVTWVNEGLNRHNVIASVPDSFEDVETEELDDGGSATRTFETAGEFAYYCSIHGTVDAGQRGWVYVADESA
jgi:plastocyanin